MVTRGIDDGEVEVLGGFKLPEGNVDGDATPVLSLELVAYSIQVKWPTMLEGCSVSFS